MGKGKPKRNYERDNKSDGKVKSLQKALKERDKQIKQLQSQLATLEAAFKKAAAYMTKESSQLSVEELIKAANKNQTLEQAKKENPKLPEKRATQKLIQAPPSQEEIQKKREEARQKALEWRRKTFGTDYEEE